MKLISTVTIAHQWPIELYVYKRYRKETFAVKYGAEFTDNLTRDEAKQTFASCMFHALECEELVADL